MEAKVFGEMSAIRSRLWQFSAYSRVLAAVVNKPSVVSYDDNVPEMLMPFSMSIRAALSGAA